MLALLISAAPVRAQTSPIVYVAADGSNSNACTFAAPCRLLQRAVNVVPAGGVVQVLDSANYGHVTINKSLTISGGGNVVTLGGRITINNANAIVLLRGLVMDGRGLGSGLDGILISAAATVHIEDCEIARFTGNGIDGSGATELFVSDTVSRDNHSSGLYVNNATARVSVEGSRFVNNSTDGIRLIADKISIGRSVASGNSDAGVVLLGGQADITETTADDNTNYGFFFQDSDSYMTLTASAARDNLYGVYLADTNTSLILGNCVIVDNSFQIHSLGVLWTRDNNTVGHPVTGNGDIREWTSF
jgi:hypothetical protein